MSYEFGRTSRERLYSCHEDLIKLFEFSLSHPSCPCDMTIVCGDRNEEDQEKAFNSGNSKAKFGQSPHNYSPSLATDMAPYVRGVGIPWNDAELFTELAQHVKKCADELNIDIRWGGDFKSFLDMPHFELKEWRNIKDS